MFVTAEGSPYTRFRRALASGNELLVLTTARELPTIALDDALQICLVGRDVSINDLRAAADALDHLPDRAYDGLERLQQLCVAKGVA
jgi:hypothetical protein